MLVIALFSVLITPYFVDWTVYKRDFERQASKIFGHPVTVGGKASIRILPLPSLSFGDLSVGKNADGSPLMSIRQFSANIELMPFLSGEVRVVDMTLVDPVINLQVSDKGTIAWTNREPLLVDPEQVKLDKVSIVDGRIDILGLAGGRTISAAGINGVMRANSLFGPWRFEGRGVVEDIDTVFTISTGRLRDEGKLRVKLDVQRLDQPYRLMLDGSIGLEKEVLSWNGNFQVTPVKPSQQGPMVVATRHALPVITEGVFSLTPEKLEVLELRTEIGATDDPFVLSGKGSVNFRDKVYFRFHIDGRQIDLDRIAQMRGNVAVVKLEERVAIVRSILEQIPVPAFSGEIDFEIPAIVAGDTIIREVSALAKPFANGWEIVKFNAKLPGSTQVEANGRLGLFNDFGFNGKLVIASGQPSGFASWAIGRVDPAIRGIKSGGLQADVTITSSQTTFENMVLLLDDRRLTGRVQRLTATKDISSRAAVVMTLMGDNVRLEDLQSVFALAGFETINSEQDSGLQNISDFDLDVTLDADHLSALGLEADQVGLKFQLAGGALSLSRLNAGSFYGARLNSSGQIADLLGKPKGNFKLQVYANEAFKLIAMVRQRLIDHPLLAALHAAPSLSENTDLKIEMDASPFGKGSRGRILIGGQVGGTELSVRTGFEAILSNMTDAKLDISAVFKNDEPEILMAQTGILAGAGFDTGMAEKLKGPIKLNIESVGSIKAGLSTLFAASTPDASVTAQGLYYPSIVEIGGKPVAQAEMDITAGFQDAAPYLAHLGYPVFGVGIGFSEAMPVTLSTHATYGSDTMTLTNLKAQLAGNEIKGDLNYKTGSAGRPLVSGHLQMATFPLGAIANIVYGANSFGLEPLEQGWSEAEFGSPLFAGKDANLEIRAEKIVNKTGLAASNARISLAMRDGNIDLQNISVDLFGGQITGNFSIKNSDRTGMLQGQFQAENISASRLLFELGANSFLEGRLRANGTIEASGKSLKALIAGMTGSGVATIEKAALKGINTAGLQQLLAITDTPKFKIDAARVEPLLRRFFLNGKMEIDKETSAYSISRGKLTLHNLVRMGEGYEATLNGEASLLDGNISAAMRLALDAGEDQVAGASTEFALALNGPFNAPDLVIDSQAMLGFLSVRAYEAELRRVEILQAAFLEKQRIRNDIVNTNTRIVYRETEKLEQMQIAEQKRLAEVQRLEEERKADELRKAEEARQAAEARALEEARMAAEARALEEARKAEAARQAAEARVVEEARKVEAERKAAEARALEEARKTEEQRILEEARQAEIAEREKAAQELAKAERAQEAQKLKEGITVRELAPPKDVSKPELPNFIKSIEELLLQQNRQNF